MKIVHITINTKNLNDSLDFYQNIIGLNIINDFRKSTGMPIVFLADSENETCIELIENSDQSYSGSGLSIGFHVENVEIAHKEAETKGLNPTPIISPTSNVKFFFVDDPNGVKIQFI